AAADDGHTATRLERERKAITKSDRVQLRAGLRDMESPPRMRVLVTSITTREAWKNSAGDCMEWRAMTGVSGGYVGFPSILQVHAQRNDGDRPAVAVVGRVYDFLEVCSHVNALDHLQVVKGFQDLLRAVIQSAVANDEIEPAGRQVIPVGPL